jgi:hypothetical protein
LQTSACVVQARLHDEMPAVLGTAPGVLVVTAGPTTTHPFWQVAATVSQVMRQDVDVDVCGSKVGGGGAGTVCVFWANAVEAPAARSKTHNMYRMKLLHCIH